LHDSLLIFEHGPNNGARDQRPSGNIALTAIREAAATDAVLTIIMASFL
jgi:hypothetical protein